LDTVTASTQDLLTRIRSLEDKLVRADELLKAALADREGYVEAEVRRRSHVFDVVLSTLPDLICTFALDGRFTYANPTLTPLCSGSGKSHWRRSLARIPSTLVIRPIWLPVSRARLRGVIASKPTVINHTPFTGANGKTRVYEFWPTTGRWQK
jgi:hypothetical protein